MTLLRPNCPFPEKSVLKKCAWNMLPSWPEVSWEGFKECLESSRLYLERFGPSDTLQRVHKLAQVPISDITSYLETHFDPYQVLDQDSETGIFTGYYEPVIHASLTRYGPYQIPIYKRPKDLLVIEDLGYFHPKFKGHRIAGIEHNGTLAPFHPSKDVWQGCLEGLGLEIAWATSVSDVYFMHVQGSGVLHLDNGTHLPVTYDGTNGYPYASLREIMIEKGYISSDTASMASLRQVLADYPDKCLDLISCNPSYAFFKPFDGPHPQSRLQAPLIAYRSLAVDPIFTPFGSLLWLENTSYSGLMMAQDLGAAIKGPIRGDIFCGTGEKAAQKAGSLKTRGRLYRIIEK